MNIRATTRVLFNHWTQLIHSKAAGVSQPSPVDLCSSATALFQGRGPLKVIFALPLAALRPIIRNDQYKPPRPTKASVSRAETQACARDFFVCRSLYLRVGAWRKVTLPASSEYKCTGLLSRATPAVSAGHFRAFLHQRVRPFPRSPAARIIAKAPSVSFVTDHPIEHGNPVGRLRGRKDQP